MTDTAGIMEGARALQAAIDDLGAGKPRPEPVACLSLTADKVRLLRDAVALQQSFLESHRRASAEPEYVAVVEGRQRDLDYINRDLAEVSWALRKVGYDAAQKADDHDYANPCKCCGEKS